MQFSTAQCLAILATLLATAQSAPVTPNTTGHVLEKRNSVNDCGSSTFINQSSTGSPRVVDCQKIVSNIVGGGTWSVGTGGPFRTLVTYGTCAFGVAGSGGGSANVAYIGNSDISDLINDSIKRFQWNGLVGAKGDMGCQSATGLVGGAEVTWGLFHT